MKTRVKLFSEVKVSRLFPNVFLLLFLFAKVPFRPVLIRCQSQAPFLEAHGVKSRMERDAR